MQQSLQPFLKWAGGKRQLLSVLHNYLPHKMTRYYEPFVGAGALFLSLSHKNCVINDTNEELINCYNVIKNTPEELIELCSVYEKKNSKEFFYELRAIDREESFKNISVIERAARIIFLNKTCYNGLYRVNKSNQFNVPYGDYKNPKIVNKDNILNISSYLNNTHLKITNSDYKACVSNANKGDFIYFDPPYQPISKTASFTSYSSQGFNLDDQKELKNLCDLLDKKGCNILLSNSYTPEIEELYKDSKYKVIKVQANRAINSKSKKRGKISELLVYNNYKLFSELV